MLKNSKSSTWCKSMKTIFLFPHLSSINTFTVCDFSEDFYWRPRKTRDFCLHHQFPPSWKLKTPSISSFKLQLKRNILKTFLVSLIYLQCVFSLVLSHLILASVLHHSSRITLSQLLCIMLIIFIKMSIFCKVCCQLRIVATVCHNFVIAWFRCVK